MNETFDLLKNLGAPFFAVLIQGILTWFKVKMHEKRLDRLETSVRGGDDGEGGLLSRVQLLEYKVEDLQDDA